MLQRKREERGKQVADHPPGVGSKASSPIKRHARVSVLVWVSATLTDEGHLEACMVASAGNRTGSAVSNQRLWRRY
jgi:hypothetical protein